MYTIANLHNIKTNRYHPIIFMENPQPSYKPGDSCIRSKSVGHHTIGFDTREQALADCRELAEGYYKGATLCLAKDFAWDGEHTPAMVVFFSKNSAGETIPLM